MIAGGETFADYRAQPAAKASLGEVSARAGKEVEESMSTRQVKSPTSFLRFGHARVDITPPVGIYHRMWGRRDSTARPAFTDRSSPT
jgi:hypothetical protein